MVILMTTLMVGCSTPKILHEQLNDTTALSNRDCRTLTVESTTSGWARWLLGFSPKSILTLECKPQTIFIED
jgi:hypothetical protein